MIRTFRKGIPYIFSLAMLALLIDLGVMSLSPSLWFDESFTVNMVRKSFSEMIQLTSLDVHPPLYYIVVKLFVLVLGESALVFHLPSLLFFCALLVVVARFFAEAYKSLEVGLFAAISFAALPNMMKYTLEIRMYSMAMFLIALSFYLSYRIVKRESAGGQHSFMRLEWILLTLVNVAAAYTHYFAGVAAAAISICLLNVLCYRVKENRRTALFCWLTHGVCMFLLYLPWLPVLFSQMAAIRGDYWISPLTKDSLRVFLDFFFYMPKDVDKLIVALFFLLGGVALFVKINGSTENIWCVSGWIAALIWLVFGIGVSKIGTPILHERYLIVILPLLWIPVLYAYMKWNNKVVYIGIAVLSVWCFLRNHSMAYEQHVENSDAQLLEYMQENLADDDVFFHFYVQNLAICSAYFPDVGQYALTGLDRWEAFRDWEELANCHYVESLEEMYAVEGNIWCINGDYVSSFEGIGFTVETISREELTLYRIFRANGN